MEKIQYNAYYLSYAGITATKQKNLKDNYVAGSRNYYVTNTGEILPRKAKKDILEKALKTNYIQKQKEQEDIESFINDPKEYEKKEQEAENKEVKKRTYKLNKKLVRKRLASWAICMPKTKRFNFVTISFPKGTEDNNCYKYLNIWLTRCRKTHFLKNYLWVSERQKNETIHFHLITDIFLPIKKVNGYMATTLGIEKYNGVDIDNVRKSAKNVLKYVTKYVSKNEDTFTKLPFHCSRSLSGIFTSVIATSYEVETMFSNQNTTFEDKITFRNEYICYAPIEEFENKERIKDLITVNKILMNYKQ